MNNTVIVSFAIIGMICCLVFIVNLLITAFQSIKRELHTRKIKSKAYKNQCRKKTIIKCIEHWLDKDIEYFDFENNTYQFICTTNSDHRNAWFKSYQFHPDQTITTED